MPVDKAHPLSNGTTVPSEPLVQIRVTVETAVATTAEGGREGGC